jgi:hypothetical protein
MKGPIGSLLGLTSSGIVGPWPCEACRQLSQFADITSGLNRVFCRNPSCSFERIIDKRRSLIIENDGSVWQFDRDGNKWQVRASLGIIPDR